MCYNVYAIIQRNGRSMKMAKIRRSMIPAESRETLLDLIDEITVTLEELQASERKGTLCPYGEGSKAAYVHVLEFIQQRWSESEEAGLGFNIEEEFPV